MDVCIQVPFPFRQNNIPLYVYTTFCLSTHLSIEAWVAFTFWLFVNNAAMNMGVQIPVQVLAFGSFRLYPEVELLDDMAILFLIF